METTQAIPLGAGRVVLIFVLRDIILVSTEGTFTLNRLTKTSPVTILSTGDYTIVRCTIMMGDRIRAARLSRGLSLRALAHEVGVSHQAIHKYERNQDVPGSKVLMALSDALGVKPDFFFRSGRVFDLKPAFRKHSRLPAIAENVILGNAMDWLERYFEVESLLPSVEPVDFPPHLDKGPVKTLDDAERLADDLRQAWGLGDGPVPKLMELLEDKGVRVGILNTEYEDFDACGFWIRSSEGDQAGCGSAAIVIRAGVPGDRQRFSMAHELGRLLLEWLDDSCRSQQDNPRNPQGGISVEAAANRFAGAFLVPSEAAYRELGQRRRNITIRELQLLKDKYGFSIQAWLRRALELDIISHDLQSRLFRELKAQGGPKTEPGNQIPPEEPGRMKRMALRAVAEGVITRSRAAELAGITM